MTPIIRQLLTGQVLPETLNNEGLVRACGELIQIVKDAEKNKIEYSKEEKEMLEYIMSKISPDQKTDIDALDYILSCINFFNQERINTSLKRFIEFQNTIK